jgi:UDP-glucose:glycoprotein glucosyltransferase
MFLLQEAVDYYKRTGLGSLPQVLMNGVPLKKEDLTGDSFEEAVVGSIMKATPDIQKAVYDVCISAIYSQVVR